jgi:NADH-quinone oxidoreductase subunit L
MGEAWHGGFALVLHAIITPVFWLAAAGAFTAWYLYLKRPDIPDTIQRKASGLYKLLDNTLQASR